MDYYKPFNLLAAITIRFHWYQEKFTSRELEKDDNNECRSGCNMKVRKTGKEKCISKS